MNLNKNPYLEAFKSEKSNRCFLFSTENINDKLSGGHIEILSDVYLLSEVFKHVYVVYPSKKENVNASLKNNFFDTTNRHLNIKYIPVKLNKSFLSKIFISNNRLDIFSFLDKYNFKKDDIFFVVGHRNILLHLILFLKYGSRQISFKSQGSMIKYNFDNFLALVNLGILDINQYIKRIILFSFFLIVENFSYVFSNKLFIMRDKKNLYNNFYLYSIEKKFKNNVFYNCASSFFYFNKVNQKSTLKKSRKEKNKIIILGSLGDNTFPNNLLGLAVIIKALRKANKSYKIRIKIAGKCNNKSKHLLERYVNKNDFEIEFLNYISNLSFFYKSLDGLIVPAYCGSGIPIKIFDAFFNFDGPILTNNYVKESSGEFLKSKNIVHYDANLFLNYFNRNNS